MCVCVSPERILTLAPGRVEDPHSRVQGTWQKPRSANQTEVWGAEWNEAVSCRGRQRKLKKKHHVLHRWTVWVVLQHLYSCVSVWCLCVALVFWTMVLLMLTKIRKFIWRPHSINSVSTINSTITCVLLSQYCSISQKWRAELESLLSTTVDSPGHPSTWTQHSKPCSMYLQ